MNNNKHAVVNSKNQRTSSMTWAGGGHCQNEVKLERERKRSPDLCQLHIPWSQPSVPKCAEVPDFLNDVTEFIPWQSFRHMRSVFTALASGTLWILWIYEETEETKDVGNGCEQISPATCPTGLQGTDQHHGARPQCWGLLQGLAAFVISVSSGKMEKHVNSSNSITFQIVKSGNWKSRW